MLNTRTLAIMLAVMAAGLGWLAGPASLAFLPGPQAPMVQLAYACIGVHVLGLLVFAIWPRRHDAHLCWAFPIAGLISAKLASPLTAWLILDRVPGLQAGLLFPMLYACIVILGVSVVSESRRAGLLSLCGIFIAVIPLMLGWLNLARHMF